MLFHIYAICLTYIKVSTDNSQTQKWACGECGPGAGRPPTFGGQVGGVLLLGAILIVGGWLVGGDLDFIFNCGDVNLRMDGGG